MKTSKFTLTAEAASSRERMVSLHARWLVDAAEYREIAKTSRAANRMLSHQLHTGRAEMLEQCAAELRAGMEANKKLTDSPGET